MKSERWQRIEQLFEEALAQPESARMRFLESACGADVELRDELISLLAAPDIDELPTAWLGGLASAKTDRFIEGDRVAGRYLIHGLLGQGGMGEVYEARDEELSITVALKTLLFAGDTDAALQRLKLEGLLARAVWHPNVCRVYDLGRHGEGSAAVWFLTMELLRGETLAERMRDERRLPLDRALRLAEQMAAGLGAAHQAGVVHRDFKPGNVMLVGRDGGEQAVVTDFGTARVVQAEPVDQESAHGAIIGTPAYMAPEQVRGEEVGPAADIYALGVVLFEMVTGTLPFSGGSSLEVARRRLEQDARSPRSVVPELDERWDAVIRRCLSREPRRRFGRAEEVAEALAGRISPAVVETSGVAPRNRHTLPAERDPFVGRETDIEELQRNLAGPRLVTLLGAGGMGKTRLAVRHGWRSLGGWPGGVWFCDLTEARNVNGIASAVAGSLGIQIGRGDPLEQLGHAITGRGRCLLILDNFEQVADHAGETVGRWMKQAPEARYVVTSRERLNLDGERVQPVEPLSTEVGLELFEARARGLLPALELAGVEAEAAREIVRLVDGMPLAIELAAARMRVMSAAEIVARMRKRFQLLTGGRSAHHETLEGTIDGSWELLTPWEQTAWTQCSVFEGGFTLEAAEAVLDLTAWPEAPSAVDTLRSLMDKSLVRTWVPSSGSSESLPEARFGMYVTLLEYARNQLRQGEAGGGGARVAEERHGAWYARYGTDDAIEALDRHGGVRQQRRLDRELDNLLAACRRAVGRGDGPVVAAAYRAAWAVLLFRGPFGAALELGREALRDGRLSPAEEGMILSTLGAAEGRTGAMEKARAHLEAALAVARDLGDQHLECRVLTSLGAMHFIQGHLDEAGAYLEGALGVARSIGDRHFESSALNSLSVLRRDQGRMEEAEACSLLGIEIARLAGDRRMEGTLLGNLGLLHHDRGRSDESRAYYEAALAIHREVGNRRFESNILDNLGSLDFDQGRLDEARAHQEAALVISREVGDRRSEGICLVNLANSDAAQGLKDQALAHFDEALAIQRELGNRRVEGNILGFLGKLHHDRGEKEVARSRYEAAITIHREEGDLRFEGISLANLGDLLLQQGRVEESREALTNAERILRELDARSELGKLLCTCAALERRSGNVAAAHARLEEAQAIAVQIGSGPDSDLGSMLAKARQALGIAV